MRVTEDPRQTRPPAQVNAEPRLRSEEDVKACDTCNQPNEDGLLKCSQCKNRFYCSKKCASVDWKKRGHKKACVKYDPAAAPPPKSRMGTEPGVPEFTTSRDTVGTEPGTSGFTTSMDAGGAVVLVPDFSVDPDELSKFQYSADKIVNPHVALGQNTLVDFFHGSLAEFRGTEHPEVCHQTCFDCHPRSQPCICVLSRTVAGFTAENVTCSCWRFNSMLLNSIPYRRPLGHPKCVSSNCSRSKERATRNCGALPEHGPRRHNQAAPLCQ